VRRFYVSYLQPIDGITTANFEIRAAGHAGSLFGPIRSEIERVDPKLQVLSLKTAQMLFRRSSVAWRCCSPRSACTA
jgi:hypothetical protein